MAAARLVQPASRYLRKQIRRNRPYVTPRTFFAREMYIIYAGGQHGLYRPLIGLAAWLVFVLISTYGLAQIKFMLDKCAWLCYACIEQIEEASGC